MGRKGKETGADVKIVIMDLMQSGISRRKLSEMPKIIKPTVMDICKQFSDTGSLENKPRSGWPPKSSPVINENQKGLLKTNRRCSLLDITAKFNEERPDPVSRRTIQHNLHKNN